MATAVPHEAAIYLGVVQFFFATTWILYVVYLPQLAAQAGIGKEWIPCPGSRRWFSLAPRSRRALGPYLGVARRLSAGRSPR
jgi:hypothetical protein